ncbi:butyrophilin subfamily 2 member A2-like [Alligator mississippiensis]|uniref:butyrophilin subfamily 2 member A2-like n=1 Tax=Alligator mississippiensis TaxID=8496 RepID=UPI0028772E89|nr:butyrophilin subfamily 2 member A2-like [Alligator mississippiensis]
MLCATSSPPALFKQLLSTAASSPPFPAWERRAGQRREREAVACLLLPPLTHSSGALPARVPAPGNGAAPPGGPRSRSGCRCQAVELCPICARPPGPRAEAAPGPRTVPGRTGRWGGGGTAPPAPGLSSALTLRFSLPATVTLDPDKAHPCLTVSADGRSVRWAGTWQDLPNNPERFDSELCVLGCEGFTSGRHCWEVVVEEGVWAMGVAKESMRRKGEISFIPEEGIWAVLCCGGQFQALTAPAPTRLSLRWVPRGVRVYLDCAGGQVSFLDADTGAPIFTFPPTSFTGDTIRPWLCLHFSVFNPFCFGSVQLSLCP